MHSTIETCVPKTAELHEVRPVSQKQPDLEQRVRALESRLQILEMNCRDLTPVH
jgi:hypothetical protein